MISHSVTNEHKRASAHTHPHTHTPRWPPRSLNQAAVPLLINLSSWLIKEPPSCCVPQRVRVCIKVMLAAGVYVHVLCTGVCVCLIKSPCYVVASVSHCHRCDRLNSQPFAKEPSLISSSLCNQVPTGIQRVPRPCLPPFPAYGLLEDRIEALTWWAGSWRWWG